MADDAAMDVSKSKFFPLDGGFPSPWKEKSVKGKKTRRSKRKNYRNVSNNMNKENQSNTLTIMGTNANGLLPKKDSLIMCMNQLLPSIINI